MSIYTPPFHMTDQITNLLAEISEEIGRVTVLSHGSINPQLRKENRIRTIHSSLAIEQNTLSLEQVTAIVNGKRILGDPGEIKEVTNAYETYEMMLTLDSASVKDLLRAHRIMMDGLIKGNGTFRSGGVGVFEGESLIHMAPPAKFVPGQVKDLFAWYGKSTLHPLIRSAIFHYEFEFIHPFADGNGRMGRLWHSLLLGSWKELFFWLPVEELIRTRQQEYYDALGKSDEGGDSASFVELMLEIICDTLKQVDVLGEEQKDELVLDAKVKMLLQMLDDEALSAAQIMGRLGLSHRPTFRKNYLAPALEAGLIEMTIPDKPNSQKQKYRKTEKPLSRL